MRKFIQGLITIVVFAIALVVLTPVLKIGIPVLWVIATGADLASDRVAANIEAGANLLSLIFSVLISFKIGRRVVKVKETKDAPAA